MDSGIFSFCQDKNQTKMFAPLPPLNKQSSNMLNFLRIPPYILSIIWLATVTVLSNLPNRQMPSFNLFSNDKLAHAAAYALLAWLLLFDFKRQFPQWSPWTMRFRAFALATLYGILMEFAQYMFHVGRMYEVDDMLANAAGAIIGVFLLRISNK
jgi:VanZ family protein